MKISAFIIALNEADRITATIKSLHFCDEIIVVDSGSTDGTQALCEALGASVVHNDWQGYGAQKRFGEAQCANDWVLNLDADEVITPALEAEILSLKYEITGYEFGFQDSYPGETTVAPFTYVKRFIRLYDRRKARFSTSPVHDTVDVFEGKIAKMKNPALHYSFRSYHHAIEKMNGYTTAQAQTLKKRPGVIRLLTEFPLAFIKIYILRRTLFRGVQGFNYAVFYAFSRFARLVKMREDNH
jgi:glycosyltransferase involved in cell wall biosynthesis